MGWIFKRIWHDNSNNLPTEPLLMQDNFKFHLSTIGIRAHHWIHWLDLIISWSHQYIKISQKPKMEMQWLILKDLVSSISDTNTITWSRKKSITSSTVWPREHPLLLYFHFGSLTYILHWWDHENIKTCLWFLWCNRKVVRLMGKIATI